MVLEQTALRLTYTEDHMRHSALWSKQLFNPWTFHWEIVIYEIVKPQPISHS